MILSMARYVRNHSAIPSVKPCHVGIIYTLHKCLRSLHSSISRYVNFHSDYVTLSDSQLFRMCGYRDKDMGEADINEKLRQAITTLYDTTYKPTKARSDPTMSERRQKTFPLRPAWQPHMAGPHTSGAIPRLARSAEMAHAEPGSAARTVAGTNTYAR